MNNIGDFFLLWPLWRFLLLLLSFLSLLAMIINTRVAKLSFICVEITICGSLFLVLLKDLQLSFEVPKLVHVIRWCTCITRITIAMLQSSIRLFLLLLFYSRSGCCGVSLLNVISVVRGRSNLRRKRIGFIIVCNSVVDTRSMLLVTKIVGVAWWRGQMENILIFIVVVVIDDIIIGRVLLLLLQNQVILNVVVVVVVVFELISYHCSRFLTRWNHLSILLIVLEVWNLQSLVLILLDQLWLHRCLFLICVLRLISFHYFFAIFVSLINFNCEFLKHYRCLMLLILIDSHGIVICRCSATRSDNDIRIGSCSCSSW